MLNELYHALDPVAFALGPFTVRWYALAYLAGFICAIVVMYRVGKRWNIRFTIDDLSTILLCAMIGVIVGGRLGYVLVYDWPTYASNPLAILDLSRGGMSFHGGFVGALLGGVVASRVVKVPYLTLVDLAMIGVPIGLFFGRCANFVNGELWGAPTDLPWGVVFGDRLAWWRATPASSTRRFSRASSCSSSCSPCRASTLRCRVGRIPGFSWWATGYAASSLNSFASRTFSLVTCGVAWLTMGQVLPCR